MRQSDGLGPSRSTKITAAYVEDSEPRHWFWSPLHHVQHRPKRDSIKERKSPRGSRATKFQGPKNNLHSHAGSTTSHPPSPAVVNQSKHPLREQIGRFKREA